ncbi:MAG: tRNA-binding protein [Candidatus Aenigmarchaeota archaeon]|nr:tRNA-binding protein [Candidatus Aenigmarchaeota archaeon]
MNIDDFQKIDIRVGKVIEVKEFENAKKPSYMLKIDFGPLGVKQSSAQITKLYTKEELLGKQIVAVVNLPPKQIANFISEVLVLGVDDEDGNVVLLMPERKAKLGARVY